MLAEPTNLQIKGFKILGISGSGRKGSYNTALLRAAGEVLSNGATLEIIDISKFPLYTEDFEEDMPQAVLDFKQKIRESSAILIAAPEYNYTVSAVLKNALEWGNRPYGDNSWDEKPVAIVSASGGPRGGARAQLHLRQILLDLNMHPLNRPQVLVGNAGNQFDGELRLRDPRTRELLRSIIEALVRWAKGLSTTPLMGSA